VSTIRELLAPKRDNPALAKTLKRMRGDADSLIQAIRNRVEREYFKGRFVDDIHVAKIRQDHSGGTSYEARFKSAAGHDSRGKYRVSGPATPFGQRWVKSSQEARPYNPHPKDAKGRPVNPSGSLCTRHKHEPA
jgi:hypothetical protein